MYWDESISRWSTEGVSLNAESLYFLIMYNILSKKIAVNQLISVHLG